MSRFGSSCARVLLSACALASLEPSGAEALEPPLQLTVTSPRSSSGTFTFSISGANAQSCAALAQKLHLDRPATLNLSEIGFCSFAAVPSSALPNGQYCVSVDSFVGSYVAQCFTVTGMRAEIGSAQLTLDPVGNGDTFAPSSCKACVGEPSARSCTQRTRAVSARLSLGNVPDEILSNYAFAALPSLESSLRPNPEPADYALWPSREVVVSLPEADDAVRPCATLFARPFTTDVGLEVGRVCMEPVSPAVLPNAVPGDLDCEPGYTARWCSDNAPLCLGGAGDGLAECAAYAEQCSAEAGLAAGSADAGADAGQGETDDADGGASSDDERTDAGLHKHKKHGCQVSTGAGPLGVELGLALGLCGLLRVRRRPHRRARAATRAQA